MGRMVAVRAVYMSQMAFGRFYSCRNAKGQGDIEGLLGAQVDKEPGMRDKLICRQARGWGVTF
jgi:hypothetical protein